MAVGKTHKTTKTRQFAEKSEAGSQLESQERQTCIPKAFRFRLWLRICLASILVILAIRWSGMVPPLPEENFTRIKELPLISDVSNFAWSLPAFQSAFNRTTAEKRPGKLLAEAENLTPHHPVVMIPGIVSTGLELWQGKPCAQAYFRNRMWGTMAMMTSMLKNFTCWLEHMSLDSIGLDPLGIKLRPALGLESADYLLPGFWVWAKMIENLADVGYDSNSMFLAGYDWRLGFEEQELRDNYFTKLKATISMAKSTNGNKKVVVLTHSLGSLSGYYFLNWVNDSCWVNDHIEAVVNIGGAFLGVPKALSALLSGEMKDTAEFNTLASYLFNNVMSPEARAQLFRSWGGLVTLLPKGGDAIWGDGTTSPDGGPSHVISFASFLSPSNYSETSEGSTQMSGSIDPIIEVAESLQLREDLDSEIKDIDETAHKIREAYDQLHQGCEEVSQDFCDKLQADAFEKAKQNLTMSKAMEVLFSLLLPIKRDLVLRQHRFGSLRSLEKMNEQGGYPVNSTWSNPLLSSLPYAPNMTMYCFYGVGKPAERAYRYVNKTFHYSPLSGASPFLLDSKFDFPPTNFSNGVSTTDGDGTVPLISLGYMCNKGWLSEAHNPSHMPVVTKEFPHLPSSFISDFRGGAATADHVDIMGNIEMIEDILRIVTRSKKVESRIISNILEIVANVDL